MKLELPFELLQVLTETPSFRNAFIVGGSVRDALFGIPVKDYDIEVFGIDWDELKRGLSRWGRVEFVGRSFGVAKLTMASGAYDFSLPRKDSKIASGHKGFEITVDPGISPAEAASRRDYTINAMMYDPRKQLMRDFYGGQKDLQNRILRHTSPAFVEDPLRVLRGMQFASRFDLVAAPETVALCREIMDSFAELSRERVCEEWMKWASRSKVPSRGLQFLMETGWMGHFPEIKGLAGLEQEPEWHPEGDVFAHTCHACDALASLPEWQQSDETSRVVRMLAVLAHDFGKASTTRRERRAEGERIVSPGHVEAGVAPTEQFLARLGVPNLVRDRVIPLVRFHLAHLNPLTDKAIRRLARRVAPETIEGLCQVIKADLFGRPPKPRVISGDLAAMQERAKTLELTVQAPRPILMGRHLIECGLSPGKEMGEILAAAFEAQLDGSISDLPSAMRWACQHQGVPPAVAAALRAKAEVEGVSSI